MGPRQQRGLAPARCAHARELRALRKRAGASVPRALVAVGAGSRARGLSLDRCVRPRELGAGIREAGWRAGRGCGPPLHAGTAGRPREQGYLGPSSLWPLDHEPEGFRRVDASERANSVLAFVRQDGEQHVVVVLNFTPVPRADYRIGVPGRGKYRILLNSDNETFGGSGAPVRTSVAVENTPFHGFERSVALTLPPLGALLLMVDSGVLRCAAWQRGQESWTATRTSRATGRSSVTIPVSRFSPHLAFLQRMTRTPRN